MTDSLSWLCYPHGPHVIEVQSRHDGRWWWSIRHASCLYLITQRLRTSPRLAEAKAEAEEASRRAALVLAELRRIHFERQSRVAREVAHA